MGVCASKQTKKRNFNKSKTNLTNYLVEQPITTNATGVWTRMECLDRINTYGHASILYSTNSNSERNSEYIIFFGGLTQDLKRTNDILVFSLDELQWKNIAFTYSGPIVERGGHTFALARDGKIIVFGGRTKDGVINELGKFTVKSNPEGKIESIAWTLITHVAGVKIGSPYRAYHSADVDKNIMYVFGGFDKNLDAHNQFFQLNLDTFTWTNCQTKGIPPARRYCHASHLVNEKLYIFGGYSEEDNDTYFNDTYVLDLKIMNWQQITYPGVVPALGDGPIAQEIQGEIYFFGGHQATYEYSTKVFKFSPVNDTWSEVITQGEQPSSRYLFTSVNWRNQMLIFGGCFEHKENLGSYLLTINGLSGVENDYGAQNPQPLIIKSEEATFKDLFLDGSFADVIFEVEGQEFPAHKAVLVKRSKCFRNLFTSGMQESNSARIQITDMSPKAFKALLSHLYSAPDNVLEVDTALELLQISDKYMLDDLRQECERSLAKHLDLDNFVNLVAAAESLEANLLLEATLRFAISHFQILQARDDFSMISNTFLAQLLNKFIPKK